MVAPLAVREPLHRNTQNERPASRAPALIPVSRPSQGPMIGNFPAGLANHQAQVGGHVPHKAVHVPAPMPAPTTLVGRVVVPPVTHTQVPVVGRGLPVTTAPVYTAPVVVASAPRHTPAVIMANPSPRRHVTFVPNSWTPVAAFAIAILAIGAVASALVAPEAALIIFPAALLLAIGSVVFKALLSK